MDICSRLERFVDDGDIRIVQNIAVPMAAAEPLSRALAQGSDTVLYTNTHDSYRHASLSLAVREACEQVPLDMPVSGLSPNSQQLTVVFKFASHHLMPDEFVWLSGLAEATVWSIRNPRVQAAALLRIYANEDAYGDGCHPVCADDGWASMAEHFAAYQRRSSEVVAVDADELLHDPVSVLKTITPRIGLIFNRHMTDGVIPDTLDCPQNSRELEIFPEEQQDQPSFKVYQAIRQADLGCMAG